MIIQPMKINSLSYKSSHRKTTTKKKTKTSNTIANALPYPWLLHMEKQLETKKVETKLCHAPWDNDIFKNKLIHNTVINDGNPNTAHVV